MQPRLAVFGPILLALLCGCSDPNPHDLVGTWYNPANELSPTGYQRLELSFTASGRFASDLRTYGSYPGQARDDLSAFSRIEGTVRIQKDSLFFSPQRRVTWDLAYGADAPEVVEEPYDVPLYEQASYTVLDDVLTLMYVEFQFGQFWWVTLQFNRVP